MHPDPQREVAGLRCVEVLELLPEVMSGDLETGKLAQVQAHLAGCDNCTRFGGVYGQAVRALRGLRQKDGAPC
jgi:hypothetical protein